MKSGCGARSGHDDKQCTLHIFAQLSPSRDPAALPTALTRDAGIAMLNGMEAAACIRDLRLAAAGAVGLSIATEELIRLRLRHGNIAEQ
jgi:hypothetical protein